MKFENHNIYQVLKISYVEVVKKSWECFEHFNTCYLGTGTSHEEFLRIWTNVTRFGVIEKSKFEFV
jgi:hypothetical protein